MWNNTRQTMCRAKFFPLWGISTFIKQTELNPYLLYALYIFIIHDGQSISLKSPDTWHSVCFFHKSHLVCPLNASYWMQVTASQHERLSYALSHLFLQSSDKHDSESAFTQSFAQYYIFRLHCAIDISKYLQKYSHYVSYITTSDYHFFIHCPRKIACI